MKKFWFYIESYVFLSLKKNMAVLYNTLNGEIFEITDSDILKIIRRLNTKKNHQIIMITEQELQISKINEFVNSLRNNYMGDLLDVSFSQKKPIQLIPYIKIHKDIHYLKENQNQSTDTGIKNYLHELTIYFDNACSLNCSICKDAFKQFTCCTKSISNEVIDLHKILGFLDVFKKQSLLINIIGSQKNLLEFLENSNNKMGEYFSYNWYVHILNINKGIESFTKFEKFKMHVIINEPGNKKYTEYIQIIRNSNLKVVYKFLIQNELDYINTEKLIQQHEIVEYQIQPYFNGENNNFFKQNVFLNKEDLAENKSTFKDILTNNKINKNYFGRLYILNNGDVQSNLHSKKLGQIDSDVKEMLFSELDSQRSWRKLRKNCFPCKSCAYNLICPPISDLEQSIETNNLCNIYE